MRILTAFAVPSALVLALIAGPGFAQDKPPAADVSPKPGSGAPKSAPANKSTATKASSSKLAPDRTGTNPSTPAAGARVLDTSKTYERCHGKDSDA